MPEPANTQASMHMGPPELVGQFLDGGQDCLPFSVGQFGEFCCGRF
jgi:hypothetical protein